MTGATATLAGFVAGTKPGDIDDAVTGRAAAYLLDSAAVGLLGALQPVHRHARAAITTATGTGDAVVIGTGTTAALSAAVFLNGIAVGDFEYEHVGSNSHPAASVFPTALALGAYLGRGGAEILTAMILGYEAGARLGRASTTRVESERGFHNPGVNGTIAAAAAASRLLRLDAVSTCSALGIAASSSAGLMAFTTTGAMTKRLHPGRSGQLGMEAALLAYAGVTGPPDILENPGGYLHAFSPAPELGYLTEDLGGRWYGNEMLIKLAPVHGHALLFAYALDRHFATSPRPVPAAIGSVHVHAGAAACNPRHTQAIPASLVDAQYSVRFCIAAAIARPLADSPLAFDDNLIHAPDIVALAQRIMMTEDPRYTHGGTITVDIDGKSTTIDATDYPLPGTPDDLWALVHTKITRATAGILPGDRLNRLTAAARTFAAAPTPDELLAALTAPVA
jgi:2-methylcitrate dehydratase PrpD